MRYRVKFNDTKDSIAVDTVESDSPIYIPVPDQTVILETGIYVVAGLPIVSYLAAGATRLQEAVIPVLPL